MPVGSEITLIYHRSQLRALSDNGAPWFKMLIFHCSDCNETINSADDESVKQIFDRLDEHIAKCPLAVIACKRVADKLLLDW